ncbi:GM11793 [Drosophila sechellia]|uniref:GM11793 n=1 Tax=Drosophila sechellia TaxID=7238 RepID=B4IH80_DROSE|nr:GM11793 [Drosophila sechellia]
MSEEPTAIDCLESSGSTVEDVQETPASREKSYGLPLRKKEYSLESLRVSLEKGEKAAKDVEMEDLTQSEAITGNGSTMKQRPYGGKASDEPGKLADESEDRKGENTKARSIAIEGSPVLVAVDSDSSVELIESPVKSSPANESEEDPSKPDAVNEATAVEAKEPKEMTDSSISSPTSESSPEKDECINKKGQQRNEQEAPGMEVDQDVEESINRPAEEDKIEKTLKDHKRISSTEIEEYKNDDKKDDVLEVELEKGTAPKATEDEKLNALSSDGDVFYDKECVNCNCTKLHKQYVLANMATLNFYQVLRKSSKQQFLCMGCHDTAMDLYEVK